MKEPEVDLSVNDISTTGNESSCFIIDLMALVQSAVTKNMTLSVYQRGATNFKNRGLFEVWLLD